MSKRLTVTARGDEILLAGVIDENAKLVDLIQRAQNGRLALDCAGVVFINSIGVREWVRMQQAAQLSNVRLELRRVAEPIVHQLNIVPATRGNSIVTSFYAPYVCEDCDREMAHLIDVKVHGKELAALKPPRIKCTNCSGQMLLADPPELYLTFFVG